MAKFPEFVLPQVVSQFRTQPVKYFPLDTSMFKYLAASAVAKQKKDKVDKPDIKGRVGAVNQFVAAENQIQRQMADELNTFGAPTAQYYNLENELSNLYDPNVLAALTNEREDLKTWIGKVQSGGATNQINLAAFNMDRLTPELYGQTIEDQRLALSTNIPLLNDPNGNKMIDINISPNGLYRATTYNSEMHGTNFSTLKDADEEINNAFGKASFTSRQPEPTQSFGKQTSGANAYDIFNTRKVKWTNNNQQLNSAAIELLGKLGIDLEEGKDKNGKTFYQHEYRPITLDALSSDVMSSALLKSFIGNMTYRNANGQLEWVELDESQVQKLDGVDAKQFVINRGKADEQFNEPLFVREFQNYALGYIEKSRNKFSRDEVEINISPMVRNPSPKEKAKAAITNSIFSNGASMFMATTMIPGAPEGDYYVNAPGTKTNNQTSFLLEKIQDLKEIGNNGINLNVYGQESETGGMQPYSYAIFDYVDDPQNDVQQIAMRINDDPQSKTFNQQELNRLVDDLNDTNSSLNLQINSKLQKLSPQLQDEIRSEIKEIKKGLTEYQDFVNQDAEKQTIYAAYNQTGDVFTKGQEIYVQLGKEESNHINNQVKVGNKISENFDGLFTYLNPATAIPIKFMGEAKFVNAAGIYRKAINPLPSNVIRIPSATQGGDPQYRLFNKAQFQTGQGLNLVQDKDGVYDLLPEGKDKAKSDAYLQKLLTGGNFLITDPEYSTTTTNGQLMPFSEKAALGMDLNAYNFYSSSGNAVGYQSTSTAPAIKMAVRWTKPEYDQFLQGLRDDNVQINTVEVNLPKSEEQFLSGITKQLQSSFLSGLTSVDPQYVKRVKSSGQIGIQMGLRGGVEYSQLDEQKAYELMKDTYDQLLDDARKAGASDTKLQKIDLVYQSMLDFVQAENISDAQKITDRDDRVLRNSEIQKNISLANQSSSRFAKDYLYTTLKYKNLINPKYIYADDRDAVTQDKSGALKLHPSIQKHMNIQQKIDEPSGITFYEASIKAPLTGMFNDMIDEKGKQKLFQDLGQDLQMRGAAGFQNIPSATNPLLDILKDN